MNESEKRSALIICAHGSTDNDYNKDFSIFFSKLKAKIKKKNILLFCRKVRAIHSTMYRFSF